MKNVSRIHSTNTTKPSSSQAKTGVSNPHCDRQKTRDSNTINRPISYGQVLDFIDDFERLELASGEVKGLLELAANLLASNAVNNASSKVADSFAALSASAKHRLTVAVNSVSETVYQFEPRIQDPWRTVAEIQAQK